MIRAYIAVITAGGASNAVLDAIRELPSVTDSHVVAGDFDIVAEIEGETVHDLQTTLTKEIHGIDGVGTTRTYVQLD